MVSLSELIVTSPELFFYISSHLEPKDLVQCSKVNHTWRSIAFHNDLWQPFYPSLNSAELSIPRTVCYWQVSSKSQLAEKILQLRERMRRKNAYKFEFYTLEPATTISVNIAPFNNVQGCLVRKVEIMRSSIFKKDGRITTSPCSTETLWIKKDGHSLNLIKKIYTDSEQHKVVFAANLGSIIVLILCNLALYNIKFSKISD